MKQFELDMERCVFCGLCAQDCGPGALKMGERPYMTEGCIECLHCLTVCPTGAISILGQNPDDCTELQGNLPTPKQMETLIKGRRSVRHYKDENLAKETIDTLVNVAWHAPTGTNAQAVHVTLIDDRDQMQAFREEVYANLGELADAGKFAGHPLEGYYNASVNLWRENGGDIALRGAPHAIITSAPPEAICGQQDTIIYLSYFELYARSMNVGTVWNGILSGLVTDTLPELKKGLGIPEDHTMGYAMSFGPADIKFHRTGGRGPALVNRVTWK